VREWLPVPGKPHPLRNAKGQLAFSPPTPPKAEKQVDPARLQKALDAIGPIFKAHREQADEIRVGDWVRRNPKDAFFGRNSEMYFDGPFKAEYSNLGRNAYVQGPLGAIEKKRLLKCSPDGWISHTPGDPMPCPEGLKIEVRISSGESTPGNYTPLAKQFTWDRIPHRPDTEIIAWKPAL
jgi:hypothetical protein